MRHKTYLINPETIRQNGINVFKCIQKPGEFVITFGGSYHAGFNMGFNCAEAVNFATKNWIDIGVTAKFCKCHRDSVQIGMEDFVKTLLEKRIIKKKEYERYLKAIEANIAQSGFSHEGAAPIISEFHNLDADFGKSGKDQEQDGKSGKAKTAKRFGIAKAVRGKNKKGKQVKELKGKVKRVYKKRSNY